MRAELENEKLSRKYETFECLGDRPHWMPFRYWIVGSSIGGVEMDFQHSPLLQTGGNWGIMDMFLKMFSIFPVSNDIEAD